MATLLEWQQNSLVRDAWKIRLMEKHAEVRHPRTFRIGKYVLAIDSLLPSVRFTKLPGTWCTAAELVDRFPDQVIQQVAGCDRQLP